MFPLYVLSVKCLPSVSWCEISSLPFCLGCEISSPCVVRVSSSLSLCLKCEIYTLCVSSVTSPCVTCFTRGTRGDVTMSRVTSPRVTCFTRDMSLCAFNVKCLPSVFWMRNLFPLCLECEISSLSQIFLESSWCQMKTSRKDISQLWHKEKTCHTHTQDTEGRDHLTQGRLKEDSSDVSLPYENMSHSHSRHRGKSLPCVRSDTRKTHHLPSSHTLKTQREEIIWHKEDSCLACELFPSSCLEYETYRSLLQKSPIKETIFCKREVSSLCVSSVTFPACGMFSLCALNMKCLSSVFRVWDLFPLCLERDISCVWHVFPLCLDYEMSFLCV